MLCELCFEPSSFRLTINESKTERVLKVHALIIFFLFSFFDRGFEKKYINKFDDVARITSGVHNIKVTIYGSIQ